MSIVALCSVAEVRAIVSPVTITDNDITSIISHASNEISLSTGASTDASDNLALNLAAIHLSTAYVMTKMKTTGELAQQYVLKGHSQSNNPDADIQYHKSKSLEFLTKYGASTFRILYGRVGPRTVNSEAVH